jgi:FlaA1/EpsC-like NDP-sugar epimerase
VDKSSIQALNEFINNPRLDLSPVGFIDENHRNQGKQIHGYPVVGSLDSLGTTLEAHPVSEIIVTSDNISAEIMERLRQICNVHQISLRRFKSRLEEIPLNEQAI